MPEPLSYAVFNDSIRKTPDNKVSVTDVLGSIYEADNVEAKKIWKRHSEKYIELLGITDTFDFYDEDGVVIADLPRIKQIISLLPDKDIAEKKKDHVRLLETYMASDIQLTEALYVANNDLKGLQRYKEAEHQLVSSNLPVIAHKVNSIGVNQRANDGYINATALCKACGKRLNNYLRQKQTEEFIHELEGSTLISADMLIQIISTGCNEDRGTWVHPQVAINLGQWASPKFAVAVSKWVFDWMNGEVQTSQKIPYHIKRYLVNRKKIPSDHFSMLDQMTIKLLGALEDNGYMIPDKLMPDISLGKTFSKWLRDQGHDPDNFPTYEHVFDDGVRPNVQARLYPNHLMTSFNKHIDQWVKSGKALEYFSRKDPASIEPMKNIMLEIEHREKLYLGNEEDIPHKNRPGQGRL